MTGWELEGNDDDKEPKRRMSRVVWAIGMFFLFSLCFSKLTIVLSYIQVIIYVVHDWLGVGRQRR